MKYLLDTHICIAFLKGEDHHLMERFSQGKPSDFALCSIVKAELFYGARKSQRVDENLNLLKGFFSKFESIPFGDQAAALYGVTRALLTKAGTPIGANDLLIASIAQAHDLVLVSRNQREFDRIPNLRVESW